MKRKVNRVGTSTLTVSLPSKWAKRCNIKQKDEIEVIEEGNNLLIKVEEKKEVTKEIEIELNEVARQNRRIIHNLYRAGYDSIKTLKPKNKGNIRRAIEQMLGFEIISQSDNSMTLKEMAKLNFEEFDSLFKRYFIMTLSISKECLEAIKKKEYNKYEEIAENEKIQGKLYTACMRIINKYSHKFDRIDMLTLLIYKLENIADIYKYIMKKVSDNKKCDKKIVDLLEKANKLFDELYKQYYKFSFIISSNIHTERIDLIKKAEDSIKTVDKNEIFLVHLIIDLIMEFYYCDSFMIGLSFIKKQNTLF